MKSRFSAFAVGDASYLLQTWHPVTRPQELNLDRDLTWTQLEIHSVTRGGPFDSEGTVEFTAHSRAGRDRYSQHETSRFVRLNRYWLYRDGQD